MTDILEPEVVEQPEQPEPKAAPKKAAPKKVTYTVIYEFKDLQDNNHIYRVGDVYPRPKKRPSKARIAELMGDKNKLGRPLIEVTEE